jgi:hypothetical protein
MKLVTPGRTLATALVAALVLSSRPAPAQEPPLTIDAVAVSMGGTTSRSGTASITIHIDRWSTDAERSGLKDTLIEKGDDKLLGALRRTKPVGNVAVTGNLGWDLHYAHSIPLPSGGQRIVFATDRPMSFGERTSGARSGEYEYLVGEVRVGADGRGQGTLVPRANVTYDADGRTLTVENYDSQPVRLTNVRVSGRK